MRAIVGNDALSYNKIHAKSEGMPLIHQVLNSCGISSILMALKPNSNKNLDAFLRRLEKKITKRLKISTRRYDFQDRVQFSLGWLLLDLLFKRHEFLKDNYQNILDLESTRSLLQSKLDEMQVYQVTRGNKKIEKDINSLRENGDITWNLLEAYIDEHKTDAELKILGSLFGLNSKQVPESEGGTVLGMIGELDPRKPEMYMKKIKMLSTCVQRGAVLAAYEYHWLVLREISGRLNAFKKEEAKRDNIQDIETIPHVLKFNNSLSATVIIVTQLDALLNYFFYCFELDLSFQSRSLRMLSKELKL
ncbi:hypothetical protein GF325_10335 [Candidatus Bathyarchaeota archaeon]|nr:hypothetical protein [Candidatus Bathyarchaeota archaeon]